jgi:transposase-like protein
MTRLKSIDQIGRPTGQKCQKHFLDDAGRELLYKLYDGKTETITYLAEKLNVPRETVKWWAGQCGLTRPRRDWTPEEEEYLELHYGTMTIATIAMKLQRRGSDVQRKATEMALRRFDDGYTAQSLAEALGVSNVTVINWIGKGWLRAEKRRSTPKRKGGISSDDGFEAYYITDRSVRSFIINHRERVVPTQENWHWLVDVLAGGKHGIGASR